MTDNAVPVYAVPITDITEDKDGKFGFSICGHADSAAKAYRLVMRALKEAGDPDPGLEPSDVRYFASINAYAIDD